MKTDTLRGLIAQRFPTTQFQIDGNSVVFFDSNGDIYETPENQAIVDDVIANYATLEAAYLTEQEEIEISDQAKIDLIDIDINSVRSIREWLFTQPGAPQYLVDYEADAIEKRKKVK